VIHLGTGSIDLHWLVRCSPLLLFSILQCLQQLLLWIGAWCRWWRRRLRGCALLRLQHHHVLEVLLLLQGWIHSWHTSSAWHRGWRKSGAPHSPGRSEGTQGWRRIGHSCTSWQKSDW